MTAHIELKKHFNELAFLFEAALTKPDSKKLPFQKDIHEWLNYFYSSSILRHCHLEYYKTDKICVLHANIFPTPSIDIPILGFDMIALGNKITGLFFDYTPTLTTFARLEYDLDKLDTAYTKSTKRQLPKWADFFSNKFYCIEPSLEELPLILNDIKQSIKKYFDLYNSELARYNLRIKKQNEYCEGQKKNDKTKKALAAEIGTINTEKFLNEYLFPEIR